MPDSSNQIPELALRIINSLCLSHLQEEIEGNLIEYYNSMDNRGSLKSKMKLWVQVIAYLRPGTLKNITAINPLYMFHINPKVTLRSIWRQRSTTVINLFGFTLGLFCVFYLSFYLQSELSYDSFHKDYEYIYRPVRVSSINNESYKIGVTSGPYAKALEEYSQVKTTCRVQIENGLVSHGERSFNEDRLVFVDPNFYEFFSFPLKIGEPETVLKDPASVVLTQEMAEKYFGNEDPMGKVLKIDNEFEFVVSGIMDEFPSKSHIEFDMVFSIRLLENFEWFDNWWSNGLITYLKIDSSDDAAILEAQLPNFMEKYFGEDFKVSGNRIDLILEPMSEIYFNNDTRFDWAQHGNKNSVIILIIVGAAILFIACFNYLNLSIAVSFQPGKRGWDQEGDRK